jgi:Transcriptional Coactivator p15 (PC4)
MPDESKDLGEIGIDETGNANVKEPIIIKLSSYKNAKFLDIRKYYKEEGEWKPTKKGITLNKNQLQDLQKIFTDKKGEIDSWLKEE